MSPLEALTPALLLWVVLVVAVGAYAYGVLGVGLPMIATPLLALVMPLHDAVIVLVIPVLVAIGLSIASVPDFFGSLRRLWFLPVAALVGALIGAQVFIRVPGFPYALILVVAICLWLWLDWHGKSESALMKRHRVLAGLFFGFAAGMFETTSNVAAPPLIMYFAGLGMAPVAMIQGFNLCFLTGKATQLLTFSTLGGVTLAQWAATLPLAAVVLVTQRWGIRARARIQAATYRLWLRIALLAMAMVILARHIWPAPSAA